MIPMTYKGYAARIEYSDEDACCVGHLAGIADSIGFHGGSVDELRAAFQEAVDDDPETCAAGLGPGAQYQGPGHGSP